MPRQPQKLNPKEFELFDSERPVRNIVDALRSGLFKRSTLDIFFEGKHYRIDSIRFTLTEKECQMEQGPHTVRRFQDGAWVPTPGLKLDMDLHVQSAVTMLHSDERAPTGKRKLKFISFASKNKAGKWVQMVLYRRGYHPSSGDMQVVAWQNNVTPLLGGEHIAKRRH